MSRRMKIAAMARIGNMKRDTEAPSGMSLPSIPTLKAQVAKMCVWSIGPPEVRIRTMSKLANVTMSEKSPVIEMMLRIIGSVTYQIFCHQLAPSMAAASYNCSGTDFSAARYMMRKNGAPYQTFTKITEKRAHIGSPSQVTAGIPRRTKIQLNALYDGSKSQNQPSVLIAGGITQGMSSMPRHLRCPLAGTLCTKCATQKPMSALKITALMAKMHDCFTTIQNVSRVKRKVKLEKPTNRSRLLLSMAR